MNDTNRRIIALRHAPVSALAGAALRRLHLPGGSRPQLAARLGQGAAASGDVDAGARQQRRRRLAPRETLLRRGRAARRRLGHGNRGCSKPVELRAYLAHYAHGESRTVGRPATGESEAHPDCREDPQRSRVQPRAASSRKPGNGTQRWPGLAAVTGSHGHRRPGAQRAAAGEDSRSADAVGGPGSAGRHDHGRGHDADATGGSGASDSRDCKRWRKRATAYERAVAGAPIANYYLARLKVRAGEIDTGLTLLERAVEDAGRQGQGSRPRGRGDLASPAPGPSASRTSWMLRPQLPRRGADRGGERGT